MAAEAAHAARERGTCMKTQFNRVDPSQYAHAWEDIPYAGADPSQVVSIYTPGDEGDYPLIAYVNGGGWVQQATKNNTVPGVWQAPSQGYALASIGHRLAPAWRWPAPVLDVKAAIRFLRANATRFGYRADIIVAWGNSAGGHVLGMCCATNGLPLFEDITMGNPHESSAIQGFVSFYAPSDLYQLELANFISPDELHRLAESPEGIGDDRPGMQLNSNIALGCRAIDNPAVAAAASPIHFVTESFPPTYFVQGMADPVIHYTQTTSMYNKVVQVCGEGRAHLELFEHAVHGDPVIKSPEVTARVYDFIDTVVFGEVRDRPPLAEIALR